LHGLIISSTSIEVGTASRPYMSGQCFLLMSAIYREPLCLLKALPLTAESLWTPSEGITPPSSLIPAHAPDQNPSVASVLPLYIRSLQVATSPCWELALPDVISADPSVDAWLPTPVDPVLLLPVPSHRTSAFPPLGQGRLPQHPYYSGFSTELISWLQAFLYVQASTFARHPDRSHHRI
jgi:hypothetical protein